MPEAMFFLLGWASCLSAVIVGHVLAKPWLDRRLLPGKGKPALPSPHQTQPLEA